MALAAVVRRGCRAVASSRRRRRSRRHSRSRARAARSSRRSSRPGVSPTRLRPACTSTTTRSARAAASQAITEPPGRLRRERRAADPRPVQRVQRLRPDPVGASGTSVAYNLPGAPPHLKITGPVLANIYLGKIKKWNDAAIKKLNPGVNLPDTTITPIFRSDGSGTTYNFTDYLSKVSPAFKSKVGVGTQVNFPVGTGGRGSSGVSASSRARPAGSLRRRGVRGRRATSASSRVKNKAGKYQLPGPRQIAAAMATRRSASRPTTRSRSSTRRSRRRRPIRSARSRTSSCR